jgi:hypothetical protein
MKTIIFILAISLFSFTSIAQEVDNEALLIQTIWGVNKRELVRAYMQLPEYEMPGFWRIYEQYEQARKTLAEERIQLVKTYVTKHAQLTDREADKLGKKILINNESYEKLHREYYSHFKKVVSPLEATQFLQFETYIQNAVKDYYMNNLPFIGVLEAERTKVEAKLKG